MHSKDNTTEQYGGTPTQVQFSFNNMNAVDAPHLVPVDEVITSTNIDFSHERGAAAVRRGSLLYASLTPLAGTSGTPGVFIRNYITSTSESDPMYVDQNGLLNRVVNGTATKAVTFTFANPWFGTIFKNYGFFMQGPFFTGGTATYNPPAMIKDDGTTATEWVMQTVAAPIIALQTLTPIVVGSGNSFTVIEGGGGTAALTCDSTTFRAEIDIAINTATFGLNTNGTHTVGDYGLISVQGGFSNPSNVTRISMDFGIGTSFLNYFHTELDFTGGANALADASSLIDSQQNLAPIVAGTTTYTRNVTNDVRALAKQTVRQVIRSPQTKIAAAKNTLNTWLVQRPNFQTIFNDPNPGGWENVGTARIVIEGTGTYTATLSNWQVAGAQDYSLTDVNVGYTWWQTFAQFDPNNGNLIDESAPSISTGPIKMQGAQVLLKSTSFPANGTSPVTGANTITHRIFYRQGGYLADAYAVGTIPVGVGTATATVTFTDSMTDIQALMQGGIMLTNIQGTNEIANNLGLSPNGSSTVIVSEPYYDRIFLMASNTLMWSMPNRPGAFPRNSNAVVGSVDDTGRGLVAWLPQLIIINDHSVYEMQGNFFEGVQADYSINRTGSKHGCKAPRTVVKTPYGVPLIDYDGISMYIPGAGVDRPIDWAMQRVSDIWRGTASTDPAAYKGTRIPPMNLSQIQSCCGAYANNRYYLGYVTATNTTNRCDACLVLDFRYQTCQIFTYPFKFQSLFWDQFQNRVLAMADGAAVMQIESGIVDQGIVLSTSTATLNTTTNTSISWNFKTHSWPAPSDILAENIAVQYRGGTSSVIAVFDQVNNVIVGTLTNANKVWTIPTMGGTLSNDLAFVVSGVQTGTQNVIYNIAWDSWIHPRRIVYYRTDYSDGGHEGEKIWDVHYTDASIFGSIGTLTGTVLATSFIDNVAVATFTLVGVGEKKRYEFAYPPETYGNIEYTIYQGQ